MTATPLEPAQLQTEAQELEQQQAWDALLHLAQRQRPFHGANQRLSGYLDYLAGRALLELEQAPQAEPLLRSATQSLPDVPFTHNLLGRALAEQKRWLAAVAAQERCLALKPDFGFAWLELGRAQEALGNGTGAETAYREAMRLLPDNNWVQRHYATIRVSQLLCSGDAQAAAKALQGLQHYGAITASQLADWLQIGAALLACGRTEQAMAVATALVDGTEQTASPSPLNRRCPLLLQGLALLLANAPATDKTLNPADLAGALQESLWLPNDSREDELWHCTFAGLWTALIDRITRTSTPPRTDQLPLLLALAEIAASRFSDHQRALTILQPALAWTNLSQEQQKLVGECAGLAAVHASKREGIPPVDAHRLRGEAIRLLEALPPNQRSARAHAALQEAHLSQAGNDLPADLQNLRLQVEQMFNACGQLPIKGSLRHDLDQLLWRLNTTLMDGTAALAYRTGDVAGAQALRRQGLDLLAELTVLSLNPSGMAPLPRRHSQPAKRWLLVASSDLPQCFLYRVEQKRDQLASLGCEVLIVELDACMSWAISSTLLWAEAVVICRLPGTYPVLRTIALAQRFGLHVYYDIDDLIFDPEQFPPPLSSYGGTISAEQHTGLAMDAPLFRAAIQQADELIVSTTTLARRWQELNPERKHKVLVLPNLAPPGLRRKAVAGRARLEREEATSGVRLLVSSGTLAHKQVWSQELAPALAEVMKRHPGVQLDLVGSIHWPDEIEGVELSRVQEIPFTDYPSYIDHLGHAQIGLAPLEPGIVTDSKSAIKWMEYSLMGLATVLSPTATYREILTEGVDCLFAKDREGWRAAVERLIAEPELRRSIARQAHDHAFDLFGPAEGQTFWRERQTLSGQPQPGSKQSGPTRRVLVINCFFAPQSVGGATRVAQDRVRALLSASTASNPIEVTVLCADLDSWQGHPIGAAVPLDVHQWYGAKVLRLGLPLKPWDWHHDGNVEQFCREWFLREQFDEVEAHCMQVLTAAPLRVAQQLGIPYRVVLHDGWWLSRLQFLTLDDGLLVDPQDPLSGLEPDADEAQRQAAIERRQDLIEILDGAKERLAVSESFAELYQRAGIRRVGVRRNNAPEPLAPAAAKQRRADRRRESTVRFCMVGGMAVHKGYAVLRAAIQAAELGDKASFTVVDHRLKPNEPGYALRWGGSSVSFIPPILMEQMQTFYAGQDVLIAASIWPESFGLVTREALAAGLWVIASRAGALAEPIQHGENGLVVEPGSIAGLQAALTETMNRYLIG